MDTRNTPLVQVSPSLLSPLSVFLPGDCCCCCCCCCNAHVWSAALCLGDFGAGGDWTSFSDHFGAFLGTFVGTFGWMLVAFSLAWRQGGCGRHLCSSPTLAPITGVVLSLLCGCTDMASEPLSWERTPLVPTPSPTFTHSHILTHTKKPRD